MPYRIGSFSNIYSKLAPDGTGSAYIEYTHQGDFSEIELLKQKSVELMLEMKMIKSINDIKFMDYRKIENGYVIYHKEYFEDLKRIEKWCAENSIKLAGRYGKWTYAAMEDAILDGMSAVSGLYNI